MDQNSSVEESGFVVLPSSAVVVEHVLRSDPIELIPYIFNLNSSSKPSEIVYISRLVLAFLFMICVCLFGFIFYMVWNREDSDCDENNQSQKNELESQVESLPGYVAGEAVDDSLPTVHLEEGSVLTKGIIESCFEDKEEVLKSSDSSPTYPKDVTPSPGLSPDDLDNQSLQTQSEPEVVPQRGYISGEVVDGSLPVVNLEGECFVPTGEVVDGSMPVVDLEGEECSVATGEVVDGSMPVVDLEGEECSVATGEVSKCCDDPPSIHSKLVKSPPESFQLPQSEPTVGSLPSYTFGETGDSSMLAINFGEEGSAPTGEVMKCLDDPATHSKPVKLPFGSFQQAQSVPKVVSIPSYIFGGGLVRTSGVMESSDNTLTDPKHATTPLESFIVLHPSSPPLPSILLTPPPASTRVMPQKPPRQSEKSSSPGLPPNSPEDSF